MTDILSDSRDEERRSGEVLLTVKVLTTSDCARALGMTSQFIRGEIRDGRLRARIYTNPERRRARYSIKAEDFTAYVKQHWPENCST